MSNESNFTEENFNQLKEESNFQRTMLEDALMNVEKKNEALQESNYELEEKKFELEQFIYRLNHDFKTPVSSIRGLIDLLEIDQKSTNKVIEKLKDTVIRLDSLLSNMAYFYNATQNSKEKMSLLGIYNSLLIKFQNDIILHKIKITSTFEPVTKKLQVVNHDFQTIFGCLISNAITFLDEEKESHLLQVDITTESSNLLIKFKDNGIGVEENYQDEIFKIFVRGSYQSKGAGLGLYILYKIIKKYKGTVGIESKLSKGMELKITIPLENIS